MARNRRTAVLVILLACGAQGARAEDADLKQVHERPALMARSRALSKPIPNPVPQVAPNAVPRPGTAARPGTDDDSVRPAVPGRSR